MILGPWECEKWILYKIPHRSGGPFFFLTQIFSTKKIILKIGNNQFMYIKWCSTKRLKRHHDWTISRYLSSILDQEIKYPCIHGVLNLLRSLKPFRIEFWRVLNKNKIPCSQNRAKNIFWNRNWYFLPQNQVSTCRNDTKRRHAKRPSLSRHAKRLFPGFLLKLKLGDLNLRNSFLNTTKLVFFRKIGFISTVVRVEFIHKMNLRNRGLPVAAKTYAKRLKYDKTFSRSHKNSTIFGTFLSNLLLEDSKVCETRRCPREKEKISEEKITYRICSHVLKIQFLNSG